ncbi:MAG: hypothetical protein ABR497_05260 [Kiritimatiellia bacterium]|nr:hypothetical protein [Lentisphaerota bacterium]
MQNYLQQMMPNLNLLLRQPGSNMERCLFPGRACLQSFATGVRQAGGLREHHRQLQSLTGE